MFAQKLQEDSFEHLSSIICKICLEDMMSETLYSYCRCSGSHSYVHQTCLLEWLKKGKIHELDRSAFAYCQICQAKILLNTEKRYYVKELKKICNQVCCQQSYNDRAQGILIILSIFLITEVFAIAMNVSDCDIDQNTALAALVVNSLLLAVCFIYFIVGYVLGVKREVVGVRGLKWKQGRIQCTQKTEQNMI